MENGFTNCDLSRTCERNSVNFGLQTGENRTGVSTTQRAVITLGIATHSSVVLQIINEFLYLYFVLTCSRCIIIIIIIIRIVIIRQD